MEDGNRRYVCPHFFDLRNVRAERHPWTRVFWRLNGANPLCIRDAAPADQKRGTSPIAPWATRFTGGQVK